MTATLDRTLVERLVRRLDTGIVERASAADLSPAATAAAKLHLSTLLREDNTVGIRFFFTAADPNYDLGTVLAEQFRRVRKLSTGVFEFSDDDMSDDGGGGDFF